jgi:hypothetical protein
MQEALFILKYNEVLPVSGSRHRTSTSKSFVDSDANPKTLPKSDHQLTLTVVTLSYEM